MNHCIFLQQHKCAILTHFHASISLLAHMLLKYTQCVILKTHMRGSKKLLCGSQQREKNQGIPLLLVEPQRLSPMQFQQGPP